MKTALISVPIERIEKSIFLIRGEKVILDHDLAEIYGVATKMLTRAVRRNIERFPKDFMFELAPDEYDDMRRQIGAAHTDGETQSSKRNIRYLPLAFTEHGALMAANVLKSQQAVHASVQVVRAFVNMRNMLASNADLAKKFNSLEKKYDSQFRVVFDAIKLLMRPPDKSRAGIGFIVTKTPKKK